MSASEIMEILEKGPMAFGALGVAAWWFERREIKSLTQELLKLATAQVTSQVENKALLQQIKETLTKL
jgi:hypothetical protein